jgi:hypothetical protein
LLLTRGERYFLGANVLSFFAVVKRAFLQGVLQKRVLFTWFSAGKSVVIV